MEFLKGISLSTLLSTPEEWHSLLIGFFEVLCPWPARYNNVSNCRRCLKGEYHYYMAGRGLGVIAWLIIAKIIREAFF